MKNWQGVRADLSDVSDEGMATAQNVSYFVQGELRRRPGLSGRIDTGGSLVTEWTDPFGTVFYVYNTGVASLVSVKVSDNSSVTPSTLTAGMSRGCFAKSNGRLYFVNDFDGLNRIERGDVAAGGAQAGLAAPTAAPGAPVSTATGVVTVGTHGFRYRFFDSKSLYMSDPSPQTDLVFGSSVSISGSIGTVGTNVIRSTDAKVDQVIIELTDAGSSTFYRAATVNQVLTGFTINIADTDLRVLTLAARDGDFGHQQAPLSSMLIEHRGRLFAWGSTSVTITGVTVSSSSVGVTVTGTTMSPYWAGRLFTLGSTAKAYRITAITGTNGAILSETYTGASGVVTGATIISATPDMLYWTRAGFPESWNPTSFARRVLQNQSDVPSGLASYNDALYLFGQRTMRALDYASDPATGSLVQVATEMGLWNQRCLIEAGGRLYGWGRSGVWMINGLIPQHISRPIDALIDGSNASLLTNFDSSKIDHFHGVYDPRERVLQWFYATADDTYPKHGIAYDLDRQTWSTRVWKQGIRASCLTTGGTTNPPRALLADENGHSWYMTQDRFDGVDPTYLSVGVLEVVTGTTSVITVVESLPTSTGTANLNGVMVTTSSGAERLISSNTANTITLATPLASLPLAGAELYLGQINYVFKSKWITGSLDDKKRPAYCTVQMVPGYLGGKLIMKVFLDYSTNPKVYTKGQSDTYPYGITVTDGSADVVLDVDGGQGDGLLSVPLPTEWHRAISVQITSTRPADVLKILDVTFVYTNPKSTLRVQDD